jgi:hypothetical protein
MSELLKNNNHSNNKTWPGSVLNKEWIDVIVPKNIMHLRNFFSDKHYHLYVKYWLAKAISESSNIDEWKKIYKKMQLKRVWKSEFKKFDRLLDSIYWNWYDTDSIIPVDNAFNILDWSHRLAWLAAIWKHPNVEILNHPSHDYNLEWFINNDFTEKELNLIKKAKKDFFQEYDWNINQKKIWFIWWSTIQELEWKWDEIIKIIGIDNLSDFYVRNFGSELSYIIDLAYLWDGIDNKTLRNKNNWITKRSNWLLWVLTYDDKWDKGIITIKNKVRKNIIPKLSEYNFDSIIHSVDTAHPLSNKIRLWIQDTVDKMNALLYI